MRKLARSDCPLCGGSKWLCEEHIPLPWKHDGCDAAGVPCHCNRHQVLRWLRVFAGAPRVDRRISKVFEVGNVAISRGEALTVHRHKGASLLRAVVEGPWLLIRRSLV